MHSDPRWTREGLWEGAAGDHILFMGSVATHEATGLGSFLAFLRAGVWISWKVKEWHLKDAHVLIPQNLWIQM